MRTLDVLYFAWLRERTGRSAESVQVPDAVATVGALMDWLRARGPGYSEAFANPLLVRTAVNQDFAAPDTGISDGDEVAFFPPVTGG